MMYDVSIIIPHFNSVISLKKLLLSIPRKENIQVIVVDDKSDKDLDAYKQLKLECSTVMFLDNETEIKSAGTCRNIGLAHAIGKWILFADADDYFVEDFYDIICRYFNLENDVVLFTPTSIEVDTLKLADRHIRYKNYIDQYLADPNQCNITILKYRFTVVWSKLIRRELVSKNEILFSESVVFNDFMFASKVSLYAENIAMTNEVIYCVTRNRGSLTTQIKADLIEQRVLIFCEYYNFLKKNLPEKDFKCLKLNGKPLILMAIENKCDIKFVYKILNMYKKRKVKFWLWSDFNILRTREKFMAWKKTRKRNKRFVVKD